MSPWLARLLGYIGIRIVDRLMDRRERDAQPAGNTVDLDIIGGAEAPREGAVHITLDRFADTPFGTFGRISVGPLTLYTVERPWEGNAPEVSCIPEGTYPLRLRPSPVVHRTSGGRYREGWEVCDVPGRTLIMIHPANRGVELAGCIAPGKGLGYTSGEWAVTNSRDAFEELMRAIPAGEHTITIRR